MADSTLAVLVRNHAGATSAWRDFTSKVDAVSMPRVARAIFTGALVAVAASTGCGQSERSASSAPAHVSFKEAAEVQRVLASYCVAKMWAKAAGMEARFQGSLRDCENGVDALVRHLDAHPDAIIDGDRKGRTVRAFGSDVVKLLREGDCNLRLASKLQRAIDAS